MSTALAYLDAEPVDPVRLREPRLTSEIAARIIETIRMGGHLTTAAGRVSIPYQTVQTWINVGAGVHPTRRAREPYKTFARDYANAFHDAQMALVARMQRASMGGQEWTETTIVERTVGFDQATGNPLIERVTKTVTRKAQPNWLATAWMLKHRYTEWRGRGEEGDTDLMAELPGVIQVPPAEADMAKWMATWRPGGVPANWTPPEVPRDGE